MHPRKSFAIFTGLLLASASRADLSFSLTPATLPGIGTNEVIFTGAFINSTAATNFLNDIQFNFTGAATNYFSADTNVFFANVPGLLLPDEIYNDVIFGVFVNSNTPPGNYSGTVTVLGGADVFATTNSMSQSF